MKRYWIIPAIVLACFVAGAFLLYHDLLAPRVPSPAQLDAPHSFSDTSAYVSFVLNPCATSIDMYWCDDRALKLRSLAGLRDYVERDGHHLRFAMNGGMYRKDRSPVGLFIQNGRVISPLDTTHGYGNFYLKQNGVFLIRDDGTSEIVTTERFAYTPDIAYATQSGPMLVIDGAIHPVFEKNSEHLNVRNGVGVRPDGTVIFAMSTDKVTLYDFASYFKSLGCPNALYLDGFVSRCYCPEQGWQQLDGDFGVMIGVVE
jgi:uncharacterized protein YigE (DUF2233 family)